jgi:hypothetical protein
MASLPRKTRERVVRFKDVWWLIATGEDDEREIRKSADAGRRGAGLPKRRQVLRHPAKAFRLAP